MNNTEQKDGILEQAANRVALRKKAKPAVPSKEDRLADMIGEYVRSLTQQGIEVAHIRLPAITREGWAHMFKLSETTVQHRFRTLVNRWSGHTGVYNRRSDAEARLALQMTTNEMVKKYRIKPGSAPSIKLQLRRRLESTASRAQIAD